MTPTDTIISLEKALADWDEVTENDCQDWPEAYAVIDAARDIRALLDAHASALRDAARYRWLEQRFLGADFRWGADEESGDEGCQTLIFKWPGNPVWGDLSMTLDAAMAALDDNTKGASRD
jgi:hypothetical protein